jgi:HD superfamily phosphodiesterase
VPLTAKEQLIAVMEAYFGEDARRIDHARKVTGWAEQIMAAEGGDPDVVIAAGVLHDIGILEAERKHGSTAGRYQELEGPPIARELLTTLGYAPGIVDEICDIIAHHHSPGVIATVNFKVLYDADWMVNLGDEYDIRDRAKLGAIIDRVFLTGTGKKLARERYLAD